MCRILIILGLVSSCLAACPAGLPVEYNGYCYVYVQSVVNWNNARTACQGLSADADLAWITTEEEHNFILYNLTEQSSDGSWLGGYDVGANMTFFWLKTGEALSDGFEAWDGGQPNGHGIARCLGKQWDAAWNTWNDLGCTGGLHYICKSVPGSTTTPAPTPSTPTSPGATQSTPTSPGATPSTSTNQGTTPSTSTNPNPNSNPTSSATSTSTTTTTTRQPVQKGPPTTQSSSTQLKQNTTLTLALLAVFWLFQNGLNGFFSH